MVQQDEHKQNEDNVGEKCQIGDLYIQSAAHPGLPMAVDQNKDQTDDDRSEGNKLPAIGVMHSR
jgi:hypothetical protein